MAARVAHALGAEPADPIVDECHNLVEVHDGVYLHRKGAAPGDGRDVLVAGTRGTPSYLVAAHAGPAANHSVAHGAGRKMSRADALRRGRIKHTVEHDLATPVATPVPLVTYKTPDLGSTPQRDRRDHRRRRGGNPTRIEWPASP